METGTRWDSNIPAMSRARLDRFVQNGSTHSGRGHRQRRNVAQRGAVPFAGDSDTGRSLQPRKAICAETARRSRRAQRTRPCRRTWSHRRVRAHVNLGHPTIGEFCHSLPNGRCRRGLVGQNVTSNVQSATHDRWREPGRLRLCRSVTVSTKFAALIQWKWGIRWIEKIHFEHHTSSVTGHLTTREHALDKQFATLRRFLLKTDALLKAMILFQCPLQSASTNARLSERIRRRPGLAEVYFPHAKRHTGIQRAPRMMMFSF